MNFCDFGGTVIRSQDRIFYPKISGLVDFGILSKISVSASNDSATKIIKIPQIMWWIKPEMDLIKCVFPAFSKFPGIFPGIFPATTILENLLSYPKIRSCHEYLSLDPGIHFFRFVLIISGWILGMLNPSNPGPTRMSNFKPSWRANPTRWPALATSQFWCSFTE